MAYIRPVKNRLGALGFDPMEKIPFFLHRILCAGNLPEPLPEDGIVLFIHPEVQKLSGIVGVFHKQMPHPLFVVVLAPELKLLVDVFRHTMALSVQVNLADPWPGEPFIPHPETEHRRQSQHKQGNIFQPAGFFRFFIHFICLLFYNYTPRSDPLSRKTRFSAVDARETKQYFS